MKKCDRCGKDLRIDDNPYYGFTINLCGKCRVDTDKEIEQIIKDSIKQDKD